MASAAAGRRYARALFSLASEANNVEQTLGELTDLSTLLEREAELRDCLLRPLHPAAERRAVMTRVAEQLGMSDTSRHFYAYLIDQRRLVDLPAIRSEFERLANDAAGRTRARVVSAAPLDDSARQRLARALSSHTGREITLETEVDPELIGGVVAQVGDLVFDGSLRTQLRQLRDNLKGA